MAIYRLSAKTISRGKGQSAIAAAAYRSGEKLYDETFNRTKDYGKKSGVLHAEVMLPESAPKEYENRQVLWNQVEASEKRKDSQLAREIQLALPKELSRDQNQELVFDFCKTEFVDRGMIADICIHDEFNGNGNHHAHVMLTTREVKEDGFGQKNRDWNQKEMLHYWRESWADHINHALERSGNDERVDHRSNYEQTIYKLSEKELEEEQVKDDFVSLTKATENPHVSLAAIHMEERGKKSWQIERFKEQFDKAKEYIRNKYQDLLERFSHGSRRDAIQSPGHIRKDERGFEEPTPASPKLSAGDRAEVRGSHGELEGAHAGDNEFKDRLESFVERLESKYRSDKSSAPDHDREPVLGSNRQPDRPDSRKPATGEDKVQGPVHEARDQAMDDQKTASTSGSRDQVGGRTDRSDSDRQRSDLDSTGMESGRGQVVSSDDSGLSEVETPKRRRQPRQERDPAKSRRKRDFERKQVFEFMGRNPKATIDNLQQSFPNVKDNALKRHLTAWEREERQRGKQRDRDRGLGRGR